MHSTLTIALRAHRTNQNSLLKIYFILTIIGSCFKHKSSGYPVEFQRKKIPKLCHEHKTLIFLDGWAFSLFFLPVEGMFLKGQ